MLQDLIDEDEDQLQDWNSVLGGKSLPKRGEKEFGPDGTETQSDNLSHARNAMYRALETPRGHYLKHKLEAIWMPDRQMAIITAAKGGYFKDLGRQTSFGHRQVIWLTGVEVTYLVERGSMMIYSLEFTTPLQCGSHRARIVGQVPCLLIFEETWLPYPGV